MGLLPPAGPLVSALLSALEINNFAGILVTSSAPSLEAEILPRRTSAQEAVYAGSAHEKSECGIGMHRTPSEAVLGLRKATHVRKPFGVVKC